MNSKKKYFNGIPWAVISIVLLFFLSGKITNTWYNWFPVGDEYDFKFNNTRLNLGILPLPKNWQTNDNEYDFKRWRPMEASGYRTMKTILVENDTIVFEQDFLKNDNYTLQVLYYYNDESPWEITIQDGKRNFRLSKPELDSVLVSWGIK